MLSTAVLLHSLSPECCQFVLAKHTLDCVNGNLFVLDAQEFRQDWEANGPMVPGLDPMDAVDRLKKFQLMFEVPF